MKNNSDSSISERLISWYEKNKRSLPWRDTRDPYAIWMSEIILQQTRVDQGLPYYQKFMDHYPNIEDLANASEDQVLRDWEGLGYYSRARNLHFTAKYIRDERNGAFPNTYEDIKKLKGVGPYTAAAIASFAFLEKKAVLDGNVARVISRLFAVEDAIDKGATQKLLQQLSDEIISESQPDIHNQAIMEYGAMICTPKNPKCEECVLIEKCEGKRKNIHLDIPFKSKKIKVKERFFIYLIIENENKLMMKKRGEKDIWANLYEFPLIEISEKLKDSELEERIQTSLPNIDFEIEDSGEWKKHLLSHQRIWAKFIILHTVKEIKEGALELLEIGSFYNNDEIQNLGKPILISNFLKENMR